MSNPLRLFFPNRSKVYPFFYIYAISLYRFYRSKYASESAPVACRRK